MMHVDLDVVSLGSLLAVGVVAAVALFLGHITFGRHQPREEKWVLSWLVFDALIHFFLEGPFVAISLTGSVNKSTSPLAILWKEYGLADSRWLVSDPTIVSIEILTVVVAGSFCVFTIIGIINCSFYRHYTQLVLCVCELYGGWMTFAPEWLTGSHHLDTANKLYLWVYLIFFNGLWVIIPIRLMYQSWLEIKSVYASLDQPRSLTVKSRRGRKDN